MKKLAVFCAGAMLCAAMLAGCGSESESTDTSAVTNDTSSAAESGAAADDASASTGTTSDDGSATGDITAEAAQEIAITAANASDATVVKCTLDYDTGIYVYDIELVGGGQKFEFEINAATGDILEQKQEAVTNSSSGASASISADEALSIAQNAAGISGGTVVKNNLDYDDGRAVYEIEIYNNNVEYEFEIDANTGAIIDQSQEMQ